MKKSKLNKTNVILLSAFVSLSFLIIFLWTSQIKERRVNDSVSSHIQVVNISNNISSFAKRAEGHLFLFLMLNSDIDRQIYHKRIDGLTDLVKQLQEFDFNKNDKKLVQQIVFSANNIKVVGDELLADYKTHETKSDMFSKESCSLAITKFHKASSNMRRSGISLVKSSSDALEKNKLIIEEESFFKFKLLLIFITIVLIFIFVFFRQSKKLFFSEKATEKLSQLSYIDGLTGIGNRRRFDEEFQKQWKRSQRKGNSFYLLMLDIDLFKQYNDTYGHIEGDRCLQLIAQSLQNTVLRQTDTVCRYGGEEFAIILSDSTDSASVAEKCRVEIEKLQIVNESSSISTFVTVSIGVGEVVATNKFNYKDSLKIIDKALYRAKEKGRNLVVEV